MKHSMKLNPDAFEEIKSKGKVAEIRLYDEKRRLVELGDEIEFSKLPDLRESLTVCVTGLTRSENFKQLFDIVGLVNAGWKKTDTSTKAAKDMREFYTQEDENKYGVLAIHIKIVN